jgi:UDP-N-acetylmuramate: L-alanyl-gamma-D-glutamyl-meso-diaminopimelate ligase
MVAAARLAIEAGWEVRGSDNPLYPPASDMVASLGVPVTNDYEAQNLEWRPDLVVLGNALSRGNPEVELALDRRMHYVSLPEFLKEHVLRNRKPIVVAGTHGKTTTTALLAHLLTVCAGPETGFLIGGQPLNFPHPARLGQKDHTFVIEGDEYDSAFFDKRAKFLHYLPQIALVTSLEFDHGDIYRDLEEIETAFQRMLRQIPKSGWLIACADNHAATLCDFAFSNAATYGFSEGAHWRGEIVEASVPGMQAMQVYHHERPWGKVETHLCGRHNLLNLLGAVAVMGTRRFSPNAVAEASLTFKGVKRRMEIFLEADGVTYVDDFAHHPTAIAETIAAARQRWPEARVFVLFEPRSNTTVTSRFQQPLFDALCGADGVGIGPIHRAERIAEGQLLNRAQLVEELSDKGVEAFTCDHVSDFLPWLQLQTQAGDVVLLLSNGAFGGLRELIVAGPAPVVA